MNALRIRGIYWFALLLTSVILSGCEVKDVELVRVEAFEVDRMDKGELSGTIKLVLNNPNDFPITVKSGDIGIYTGKSHMGDASLAKPLKIRANTTASYDVEVEGTIGDVISAGITGLAGLLTGQKPEMKIKGELKVGNFLFTKKVPVELKTDMPVEISL